MQFTYNQFDFCARHLQEISKNIDDTWIISQVTNGNEIFLKKFVTSYRKVSANCRLVSWEYNIVYSYSYSTPVLYFNACFENGKLLSLEEVETLLNPNFRTQFVENKWNFLSQQEHPYHRRPFFVLHPCNTEDFMQQVLAENLEVNPLVTWLSTVAPVIELDVDLDYGRTTFNGLQFNMLKQN